MSTVIPRRRRTPSGEQRSPKARAPEDIGVFTLRAWWPLWAAIAFHLSGVTVFGLVTGFPNSFDEIQHYSYARWMFEHRALFPRFENLPVLSRDLQRWGGANYLNHPSPYYLLLAALDHPIAARLANIAISTAAVALMIAAGFRVLRVGGERLVFAALIVLFPKLGLIGAIVNNDNAGLVAAAALFSALTRWEGRASGALLATALALSGWTKFTVFLMALFAVALFWALRRERPGRRHGVAALGALVGMIPTLVNLLRYHAPLWHPSNFFVPVADRAPMTFLGYARLFATQMVERWPAADGVSLPGALSLGGLLALGVVVLAQRGREWALSKAYILALPPTLALHLWFGWRNVVQDGYLDAGQTRYYYALWPGFALGLALLWSRSAGLARTGITTAIMAGLVVCSMPFTLLLIALSGRGMAGL